MRTATLTILFCLPCLSPYAQEAQAELSPEEQAEIAREQQRAKRIEEMLPNTQALVFIDSLVVDKDDFLTRLRLPADAGQYTTPEHIIPIEPLGAQTGQAAYVNALQNAAFFSVADAQGRLLLNATYRNGDTWLPPQPIAPFPQFDYQDYPFLLADGKTLHFASTGDESIGGLDLFATRYNEETRQFVRPQNLGFPYNSTANDYLLAIDEDRHIGTLVSDRRQPDDKVCIYWFIADDQRTTLFPLPSSLFPLPSSLFPLPSPPPHDTPPPYTVEDYAAILSIAMTQTGHEADIAQARSRWDAALQAQARHTAVHHRFVITDQVVYTNLQQFRSQQARHTAAQWIDAAHELQELERRQQQLRKAYATHRSDKHARQLIELETKIPQQRATLKTLAKRYRAEEQAALTEDK